MKKISCDSVKSVCDNRHLTLINNSYWSGGNSVCPLTALYCDRYNITNLNEYFTRDEELDNVFEWAKQEFGSEYASGFILGVDGGEREEGHLPEWHEGFADGRELFKTFFDETSVDMEAPEFVGV